MPRRRPHDPPGLPEQLNVVTDSAREAEIVAEIGRKIRHLKRSYLLEMRLGLDKANRNASIARLKLAVESPTVEGAWLSRLNPWLELAINLEARELAGISEGQPIDEEHGAFVRQAVRNVAARAKPSRGTPGHLSLRRYVEALMVIFHDATGKAVIGMRDKAAVYDPQMPGTAGSWIRMIVDDMEPNINDSRLVFWIRQARKKYADKWPTFDELFPGYALEYERRPPAEMLPERWPGMQFGIVQPIYCPV